MFGWTVTPWRPATSMRALSPTPCDKRSRVKRPPRSVAKIDGSTVVVGGKGIKNPVAVRFAWDNIAEHNLFNKEGLPASTFRTDDWEIALE